MFQSTIRIPSRDDMPHVPVQGRCPSVVDADASGGCNGEEEEDEIVRKVSAFLEQ
jgi:hypothetical protein